MSTLPALYVLKTTDAVVLKVQRFQIGNSEQDAHLFPTLVRLYQKAGTTAGMPVGAAARSGRLLRDAK